MGTAGAGKSLLTRTLSDRLREQDTDVATKNLAPGVVWLPYSPDVDVSDCVNYDHVLRDYNLGPNGALIAAFDLLIPSLNSIRGEIKSFEPEYVIADTPGQLELFAFNATGNYLASSLANGKSAILFLCDSNLMRQPSSLVSTMLLSASVRYRFWKPQVNVLTKVDLLSKEELKRVGTCSKSLSSSPRHWKRIVTGLKNCFRDET